MSGLILVKAVTPESEEKRQYCRRLENQNLEHYFFEVFRSKKWSFFVFKLFGELKWRLESICHPFYYVLVLQML